METPIITVKNIGKKYNITHQRGGYIALRDVLMNILKSPFKFLKSKAKQVAGMETKEDFWALSDINFEVMKGEVIGIIGGNGAGKSTLLKILSQITPPTTGEIKIRGRVGSLLEVGTGFHPELSGRENIFLNGAILGMQKKEIEKKFDEIVAFAGIERFLDTPVKHYSSGMYVRLAFSVAAHMEPDILIIDEVLAVGDAEFQKKCLGKMEDITSKEGRTILFVSHNMGAIQQLCKKTIWLENGQIKKIGETFEVINMYTERKLNPKSNQLNYLQLNDGDFIGKIVFTDVFITDENDSASVNSDSNLKITLKYTSDFSRDIPDIRILISVISQRSQRIVLRLDSHGTLETLKNTIKSSGNIICQTDKINLTEGEYLVEILILPQKTKYGNLKIESEFDVVTDISKYNYRLSPDKNICDYLVKYSFKQ